MCAPLPSCLCDALLGRTFVNGCWLKAAVVQGIPDEYDEADINRLFSGKLQLLCISLSLEVPSTQLSAEGQS